MAEEGTFTTNAEVLKKAGTHASAVSTAEAYTNQYIQEAEGYIMCACRYDFKTNYASLEAELKEVLREAASNLAAIYVINYDILMSGYPYEANDMINLLKARFDECLELLKDQKTVTYGT